MPTLISPTVIDTSQQFSFSNVAANVVSVNTGIVANGTLGTSGQVLTSNGSASYWAPAAGGGVANFVAASNITAGNVVVLNSNGTVSTVGNVNDFSVTTSNGGFTGTSMVTDTWSGTGYFKTIWLSSNTYVLAYHSSTGTRVARAQAYTISGGTVTAGSTVALGASGGGTSIRLFKINDTTFGSLFRTSLGGLFLVAGSVSGTTITVGTAVVVDASPGPWSFDVAFDPNSSSYVVVYTDGSTYQTIKWASYTISGLTWTFRNSGNVYSSATETPAGGAVEDKGLNVVYHAGIGKLAVINTWANAAIGASVLSPVSANSTNYVRETYTAVGTAAAPLFTAYEPASNNILTMSGRNGTAYGGFLYRMGVAFNSGNNTHTITANTTSVTTIRIDGAGIVHLTSDFISLGSRYYAFSFSANGSLSIAKVNVDLSNNITVGTPVSMTASHTFTVSTSIALNEGTLGIAAAYANNLNSNNIAILPGTLGVVSSTFGNWIGISTQNASPTQTIPVTIMGGVNDKQTGLAPGSVYFVQSNGLLSTTTSSYKVGKALSANTILITVGNA